MLTTLKGEEVEKIHAMSLEILDDVGIEVNDEKTLAILKERGGRVGPETNRVHIPPAMVENALKSAPKSFVLYGREEDRLLKFERGNLPLFGPSGYPFNVLDIETGEKREITLKDLTLFVKLLDGLPNVDFVSRLVTFTDTPKETQEISAFFHLVNNTRKPVYIPFSAEVNFKEVMSMINFLKETVYKGRTFVAIGGCPIISPLRIDETCIHHLIEAARAGIPVCPKPMPQVGVSAPATLAGGLIIMNCEILALLVLSQVVKAGAPFIYGTIFGMTNFRTGEMLFASPEHPLLNIAATQLAEYYGLPNWASAGRTESKMLDIQSGYEHSFSVPLVALAGATFISSLCGLMSSGTAVSFEQLVIDDEIAGMTRRVLKGIEIDSEHCALDLVKSLGPGGNFLAEHHTIQHMRKDFFFPSVADISGWAEWERKGRPTALQRAKERAKKIIASHSTPPLPQDVCRQIRDAFPNVIMDV